MTAKKRKRKTCRWVWDDKYAEWGAGCGMVCYDPRRIRNFIERPYCDNCGKPIEVVK